MADKNLRDMDERLWLEARAKALEQGVTMRELVDQLLRKFVDGKVAVASARQPVQTDSGALRYRGPTPLRLRFLVMPSFVEGRLPHLVKVLPGSDSSLR
jgi:hypothetical protein